MKQIVCVLVMLSLLIGLASACQQASTPITPTPEAGPPVGEHEPTPDTKADLLDALVGLEQAILDKIDSDIDSTTEAFTDVKAYWKLKRWADILKVPLRIIEDTIAIFKKASDWPSIAKEADKILDSSKANLEIASLMMMLQDLQEVGGKLQLALDGPAYTSAIKSMLEAADATYVAPLDRNWRENYKKVIENHLFGVAEDTPLVIPRKSTTVARRNLEFASGALQVRSSISRKFKDLVAEIEGTELPQDFPVDKVIAQLNDLKLQVIKSQSWSAEDITYETYLFDGDKYVLQEVETSLGAVGSRYTFFGQMAGDLDKKLEIEASVEIVKAGSGVANVVLLYVNNYAFEDAPVETRVEEKIIVSTELALKGFARLFYADAEEAYYTLPQEMVLSLPIELSNLWMIADDTDQYLRHLLGISAQLAQNTIYCFRATLRPTIDGVLSPGEWPEAAFVRELSYHNEITGEDERHLMMFYSVHDEENLYIGVKITNDDFQMQTDVSVGELYVDVLEIYFDGNNNGLIEPNEGINNFWWLEFGDWFYRGEGHWRGDITKHGTGKATHSNPTGIGDYAYEFEIPLNSGDPQDLAITPHSTVGIMVRFREMYKDYKDKDRDELVYRWAGEDGWPVFEKSKRFDGETYGKLILVETPYSASNYRKYPTTPDEVVIAYFGAVIEGRDSEAKRYLDPRFLKMLEEGMTKTGSKTIEEFYEAAIELEKGVRKLMKRVETIGVRVWVPDEEVDVDYRLYFEDGTYVEFDMRLVKEDSVWKIY